MCNGRAPVPVPAPQAEAELAAEGVEVAWSKAPKVRGCSGPGDTSPPMRHTMKSCGLASCSARASGTACSNMLPLPIQPFMPTFLYDSRSESDSEPVKPNITTFSRFSFPSISRIRWVASMPFMRGSCDTQRERKESGNSQPQLKANLNVHEDNIKLPFGVQLDRF